MLQQQQATLPRRVEPRGPALALPGPRPHPLDALAAEELSRASQCCKAYAEQQLGLAEGSLRFNSVAATEPVKGEVLAFLRGEGPRPRRTALAIIEQPARGCVVEARVDLDAQPAQMLSWKEKPGVQAALTLDDVLECESALKRNARFRALMAERYGIADVEAVAVDPWYSGQRYGAPEGRILQCLLYQRASPNDNHYAHPLDCVIFYDFHADKIHDVVIHGGEEGRQVPAGGRDANFHRELQERPWRTSLRPLDVVQPEGPSWHVEGNQVTWEGWHFHVGFSWREGLILNNLQFEDQGRMRPVLYRAAVSEIIVPYGEPRAPFEAKCAYDVVDYGLGLCANPLVVGCDCLGLIKYFDGHVVNSRGEPQVIRRAVCMKEEDAGMAWKHYEYRNGHTEVRRHRRLVLSFIATIANYEYGFYWSLHQDGTIGFEVKLTGIVSTHALFPEERAAGGPQWGTLVAPGVNAFVHQHFFQVRLDMAVDCPEGGAHLQVVEVEAAPMPLGPGNPHGIGFDVTERVLRTEQEAQRNCAPERSRIQNPRSLNPVTGRPVAFKLAPGTPTPPMLAHPTSTHATRGAFATKHLWVTAYDPNEMNPAGDYPLDPSPDANLGLAQWTATNRPLDGADCVVWHTLGLTHVVRTEDWPVMNCEKLGFDLKPWDFFTANPTIDLPPAPNRATLDHDLSCCAAAKGAAAAACCSSKPAAIADAAASAAAGGGARAAPCCARPADAAAEAVAAAPALSRTMSRL